MMSVLIGVAVKSLLIAGATLVLLALFKRRSAAERSWVAHIGLFALVVLAFAPLALPRWTVEAPALMGHATTAETPISQAPASAKVEASPLPDRAAPVTTVSAPTAATVAAPAKTKVFVSPAAAAAALYAIPALLLLLVTLLALMRLVALRARADVLVDSHWLSALARAQRRMGFKHGTALLTSDDLASPISWGLMRPVILLNSRAVEASGEAEAIIAHELAHVARMDWVKLLLARVATALFWFNPLVWALAREAHQLREEAADDAVLGANICDTDYAQLLVGVARHECPGLLLGAHGVAPSKSSLARRVARVLDAGSARAPAARPFAMGVLAGASLVAAPLAALTLTPGGPVLSKPQTDVKSPARVRAYTPPPAPPADLGHIIASGVTSAVAAVGPATAIVTGRQIAYADEDARDAAEAARDAAEEARDAAQERREAARDAANEAREAARDAAQEARDRAREARGNRGRSPLDELIEAKAVGVTPEYVSAMRAVAPQFARMSPSDFSGLKAVGVTPDYARGMVAAGLRNISVDELTEARAVGVTGDYVRAMITAGIRGSVDDFVQLRAVGVTPSFVQKIRRAGYNTSDADKIVELQALGVNVDRYHLPPPAPPKPPKVPPRHWNPITDPDGDGHPG